MKYNTHRNSSSCLWKCGKLVRNGHWSGVEARKSETTSGSDLCGAYQDTVRTRMRGLSFHGFHKVLTILPKLFTSPIVERWREIAVVQGVFNVASVEPGKSPQYTRADVGIVTRTETNFVCD
jgi:hypothetical protein